MAIFGDFSDFHLREVLALVGKRTGKLRLRELVEHPKVDIHLHEGKICGVVVGDLLVDDFHGVRERLGRLSTSTRGIFEFTKAERYDLRGELNQPGLQIIESQAGDDEEIRTLRDKLPHPHTRFVLNQLSGFWLEDDLLEFLDLTRPYLTVGVDAEELASTLGQPLERVQLKLYKLRIKSIISPLRAAWKPQTPTPAPAPAAVAKRIDLAALSAPKRIDIQAVLEPQRVSPTEKPPIVPAVNRTGVIQKMLFALYPRRWKF